jgi:hypothetical protein
MPEHFGLFILAGGVVAGIVLVVTGATRVVRSGTALKRRLEGYRDLPLRADFDTAEWKIAAGERALTSRLPVVIARSGEAAGEIVTAGRRIGTLVANAIGAVRRELRL